MEKFYELQPEVAGSWGENTEVDVSTHPPIIHKLHYHFDGWLGDDLLTSFPVFIVSEKIYSILKNSKTLGYQIETCETSVSEIFEALKPDVEIPPFFWLKIAGKPYESDFWINEKKRLVVSEKALEILKKGNLEHCLITEV